MPKLTSRQLTWHRWVTAVTSGAVVDSLIDPAVYRSVGLDPQHAQAVAWTNPYQQECRR